MNFIESIELKLESLIKTNLGKILIFINTYLITQIISIYITKYKIGNKKFLFNGVRRPNYTSTKTQIALSKFFIIFISVFLLVFFSLKIIQSIKKNLKLQYILLLINIFLFAMVNAAKEQTNLVFAMTLSVIVVMTYYYIIIKKNAVTLENFDIKNRTGYILVSIGFLSYLIIVGGLTIIRYINFHQSIFDTSIFGQMYYYMGKNFQPYTTIERRRLVSHFAVHFAPAYYILLPGYLIFRSVIYLGIMKTILLASAAFPLYKLCKQKGLSNFLSVIIAITYLLSPMLISSNIGDGNGHILNENYFYPAFLIWLFYYIEKENYKAVWIFSILTLFVKEDGPFIIASIALYIILSKKSKQGIYLFIASAFYFVACSYFIMPRFGKEVLFASMYSNFVPSNDSALFSIFYAFVFKPSYVLQQVFTHDKVTFLIQILAPILFLPLISLKKLENLVLIIPIILTSLLCKNPMYIYKFSSHHNMAPICILFFLTILTLSNIESKQMQFFLICSCLCVTCIIGVSYNIHKFTEVKYYIKNKDKIETIDAGLNKLPKNASVTASSSFTTKLTNRDNLYPFYNASCDFVVLDLTCIDQKYGNSIKELLKGAISGVYNYKGNSYGVYDYKKNLYLILEKNHSTEQNSFVYTQQFGN